MAHKLKLRGKELIRLGYPEGKVIGLAINTVMENYRREKKEFILAMLRNVVEHPENFRHDRIWGRVAAELLPAEVPGLSEGGDYPLEEKVKPFPIYGPGQIEESARHQMYVAMRLPVAVAGALMPDAHVGYGLPIGGVLATDNAVIPYGVGVDIGCRMCLSVYDRPPAALREQSDYFKQLLLDNSRFGMEEFARPLDDPIFSRDEFKYIRVARDLRDKAYRQIGSSGGGNHFVEFGEVTLTDPDNEWKLPPGTYLGVLSHSGSRGLGAKIAHHYTQLAMKKTRLPKEARHLAWLGLDTEEGHEYWHAMTLAGDYASACHDHIHRRMARSLGTEPVLRIENHHNFAWKEKLPDGREVVVHRKGATPAARGELGIIPGSMTAPGFIVRGRGQAEALYSASHGAGRVLSRSRAKAQLNEAEVQEYLRRQQVELIGGGLDEAPMAYKDIHAVMAEQRELVDIVGRFQPRIVRMAK